MFKHPELSKSFQVVAAASQVDTGVVLLQEFIPVTFISHRMSHAKQRYTVIEQELLGVMHALRIWSKHTSWSSLIIISSCPMLYLCCPRGKPSEGVFSQGFDFEWRCRPGRLNVVDPLSGHMGCTRPPLSSCRPEPRPDLVLTLSMCLHSMHQSFITLNAADP